MHFLIFSVSFIFLIFFVWYLTCPTERQRRVVALGTIGSLFLVCALSLFKYQENANPHWRFNIRYGLDIQGGTQFTIQIEGHPDRSAVDQAVEVIRKRIDSMGLTEPVIQPSGDNRIIVQIPGVSEEDKEIYRRELQRVARLEFRMVHPKSPEILSQIAQGTGSVPVAYEILPLVDRDKDGNEIRTDILVKRRAEMGGKYVQSAWRSVDQMNRPVVIINFNSQGQSKFGKLTERNVGERLAIVLDDEVHSAPSIRGPIYGNCEISGGNMTAREAEVLASVLENPLQTPVKIVDERGVDPSLGHASVKSGFIAGVIGLAAVILFMLFYYRIAGVLAVITLALNMFILLGLLAQFRFTLTMPGVAAIVLTIGMAVDASVLIFERIREELESGKKLDAAVEGGFDKAFSSIMDANVTTIIAAILLFMLGSGPILGFAVVLCLGVLSSMFSALIITRTGFEWLLAGGRLHTLSMARIVPSGTSFDFIRNKYIAMGFSVMLLIIGVASFAQRGEEVFGVDFAGGDLITFEFQEKVSDDQIRKHASSSAVVQYQHTPAGEDEILSIRTPFGEAIELEKTIMEKHPDAHFKRLSLDKVDSQVGEELKGKALFALMFGLIGIFLYTLWRFELGFAVGAIVALLHDVVISVGIFVLCGRELSIPIIGAILSVAGYSINDTIVIFDRIREGMRSGYKGSMAKVMNECLNLTLSRTLITSVTTLLATLALFLFGGIVINSFALILLAGIVVGTYSSLFIATPIALALGANPSREKALEEKEIRRQDGMEQEV